LDGLRVLLVDTNAEQLVRLSSALHSQNHVVLPAHGIDEASEALCAQKFDAVLLGSPLAPGDLKEFAAAVQTLDRNQRTFSKTPILLVSDDAEQDAASGIDAHLPPGSGLDRLSEAVVRVHQTLKAKSEDLTIDPNLPVLKVEDFREQVAYDDSLLVELIDLFLLQRAEEGVKMREALAAGDLPKLGRIAHTLKGSLGSIHALRARASGQQLETASASASTETCARLLQRFEKDLDELEPELVSLRSQLSPS
jgi:two-component system, sensor histidine kinase and response regulator